MPRDLFVQTVTPAIAPARSKWTIAGSFIAHLAVVLVMVIVPIVSTTAGPAIVRGVHLVVVPPPPMIPPSPPPPAVRIEKTTPIEVDQNAAPIEAGTRLTEEPVAVTSGRASEMPSLIGSVGPGVPGAFAQGPGGVTLTAPPKVTAPIRPGGDVKPPQRTSYVAPVYPQIAQAAKIEGMVILEAIIDESGVVRDVKVLRSIPLLDKAAIDAVSKWRYTPTRLNGTAVSIIMTVTVMFNLNRH